MNTNLVNKRKEGVTSEETPPTKKLSREARKRRNKRLKREREHGHEQNEPSQIPEEKIRAISDLSTELNITFDPSRHKTQSESRKLTKEDTQQYILSRWISEDFLASDLRTSNNEQSVVYTDPRLTFQEKFLEKRRQRLVVRELLNQGLLPLNTIKPDTYTLDFCALSIHHLDIISDVIKKYIYNDSDNDSKKSLASYCTQPIPTSFEFPAKFMDLLESEVFNRRDSSASSELERSKSSWKKFALWACFNIGPNYILQLRRHCRLLWTRTQCIYQHVKAEDKPLQGNNIRETFFRNPKDKLYIADGTTKVVISGNNLGGYYHISDSQCFKNSFEETIVDLFDLGYASSADNQTAVGGTRIAVDQYYQHTNAHPSHQSKQFAKDLIEFFGGFTGNNNLSYTTANTASSHREEHQKCVRDLIKGLQPLSNAVNKYLETTYPALYLKMKKLDLGPNVPKSFGAFPTIGINFNVICQFHRDLKDHRNTLCVVCPLGNFEGGELVFPELKLVVHVKQGQAVAFRSNLLVHGNLPVIAGVRHSVVFYIHNTVIKQKRKFGSLFADYDLDWGDNDDDEPLPKYLPPMLGSGDNVTKLKNHRRTHIDVEGAKKGLPARYKK